ncbi:tetratricopeptide repeat protein [Candidatus Desantisbacteria bacterium]|nr:tetratricopeptide repeat protein [Candidatus Desantisbacteria bacterium]
MKSPAFDKYCQFIIEGSLMLLLFFVPWWVDTRLSGIMLGKLAMMQLFTITCLIGLLIKASLSKKLNFRPSFFDLPLCIFLIVAILSTVFSVCPYLSLWGAYYRYEGLITFINYFLLFYITANWLDKEAIFRILGTAVFAGAVVSLYGLLQHLHIDLIGWREYGTSRVISTFGNCVYFGAYVATVFPLALAGYLMKCSRMRSSIALQLKGGKGKSAIVGRNRDRILNLIYKILPYLFGIACLLILAGMFVANTRGAFLGFVASCIIFGVLIRKRIDPSMKPRLILLIAGMICISLYFILNPEVSPLKRFMQTFTTQTDDPAAKEAPKLAGGAASRVFMWRDALGIIKDYPLIGTGPETFGMVYSRYRSLDLIRNEGGEYGRPDRVHNDIIDLAITKGLLGVFAYLWFLFVVARVCLRVMTEGRMQSKEKSGEGEFLFAIAIFSGGIGYFVQNQFCFWILPSTTLFFIMAGCIAGLAPCRQVYNVKIAAIPITVILIAGLAFCVVRTTLPWYKADMQYKQGAELYWSGEKIASIDRFKSALSLNPSEKLYAEYIIHAYLDTSDKLPKNIDSAIFEAQRMSKSYPLESNFYNLLGMSYERKRRFEDARRNYEKMFTIDPLFGEARDKVANIYLNQNKSDKAIAVLEEGLRIIPDHVLFLNRLAQIYMSQKRDDKAEKYLKDVARVNPDNLDSHTNLARIYYGQKRMDLVIAQCKEMIRIDPNNVDTHRNLGSLYYQQRRYQEALNEFQKVLGLKPDDEYSKRLVERLISEK